MSAGPLQVVAYVPEDALPRLRAGQTARFIADGGAGPDLDLRVRSID
ncbi:HlyD family efflux transporter periplasmic adaptor subunit [Achromobacter xylosoxidans]